MEITAVVRCLPKDAFDFEKLQAGVNAEEFFRDVNEKANRIVIGNYR